MKNQNLHLVEFVRTEEGKEITLNRIVKDETWFKEVNEIMAQYNGVYIRANHKTKVLNGKALTCKGEWVPVRTRTNTSIKVSNIQDFGKGLVRRVVLGTKDLADAMLKEFRFYQEDCVKVDDTTIDIPYKWSVLPDWEIRKIYSETRIYF